MHYIVIHVSSKRWVIFRNGEPESRQFDTYSAAVQLCQWWNAGDTVVKHVRDEYATSMRSIEDKYSLNG